MFLEAMEIYEMTETLVLIHVAWHTEGESVMRDYEVKGNMTNTEPEKHQPNNEEDLPVVLLHGTSGQSEDCLRQ